MNVDPARWFRQQGTCSENRPSIVLLKPEALREEMSGWSLSSIK